MGDAILDADLLKQLEWADGIFDGVYTKFLENPDGFADETSRDGGEGNEFKHCFESEGIENDLLATMEKLGVLGNIIKTPTKPTRPTRPPRTPPGETSSTSSSSSSSRAITTTITTTSTTTKTTVSSSNDAITNVGEGVTPSGRVFLKLAAMRKLETGVEGGESEEKLQTFLSQITTEAAASSGGGDSKEKAEKKRKRPRSKPAPLPPPINSIKRTRRTTTKSIVSCATTTNATVATAAAAVTEEPLVIDLVTDDEANGDKDEDTSSSSSDDEKSDDDEEEYHGVKEHKLASLFDAFVVKNNVIYESSNHRSKRWAAKAADQIRVALYGSVAKPLNFPKNLGKYLKGGISESILECVGEKLCTEVKRAIIKEEN
jgi:hypothetical protein